MADSEVVIKCPVCSSGITFKVGQQQPQEIGIPGLGKLWALYKYAEEKCRGCHHVMQVHILDQGTVGSRAGKVVQRPEGQGVDA